MINLRRPPLASSLLSFCACALLLAVSLTGCQTTTKPPKPTDTADMAMSTDDLQSSACGTERCENPSAICCFDEPCVDTLTNPLHCGGCGKACRAREVCGNGMCACRAGGRDQVCPTDSQCCSDGCKNVTNDVLNCGGCGLGCKMGETCAMGKCACGPSGLGCSAGQTCCPASGCSNLQNDPNNCGTCGKKCAAGKACKAGLCEGECTACSMGETCCDGVCANLLNDPRNCKMCGRDCMKITGWSSCILGVCLFEKTDMGASDMTVPTDM